MATRQLIHAGTDAPVRTALRYWTPYGAADFSLSATESEHTMLWPAAGVLKRLMIYASPAPGAGSPTKSWTVNARINGADSSLATSLISTDNYEVSAANLNASVSPGDRVAFGVLPANTPAATDMFFAMEFIPTIPGQTVMCGSSGNTNFGSTAVYLPITGSRQGGTSTIFEAQFLCITSGYIDAMYVLSTVAPGVGQSRTATLNINGVDTVKTCTISGTNTTANILTDPIGVGEGDLITIKWTKSASPAAAILKNSIVFVPDKIGEFMFGGCGQDSWGTASEINHVLTGNRVWTALTDVQSQGAIGGGSYRVTKIGMNLSVAPGVGNSRSLELLWAGTLQSPSLKVTIPDLETMRFVSGPPYFHMDSNGLTITASRTNSGTPAATKGQWSFLAQHNDIEIIGGGIGSRR